MEFNCNPRDTFNGIPNALESVNWNEYYSAHLVVSSHSQTGCDAVTESSYEWEEEIFKFKFVVRGRNPETIEAIQLSLLIGPHSLQFALSLGESDWLTLHWANNSTVSVFSRRLGCYARQCSRMRCNKTNSLSRQEWSNKLLWCDNEYHDTIHCPRKIKGGEVMGQSKTHHRGWQFKIISRIFLQHLNQVNCLDSLFVLSSYCWLLMVSVQRILNWTQLSGYRLVAVTALGN